ncbi:hypothetical protein TREAZ_0813 [Leadbettera azotonutricia ZAS-9]|uniref:Uncharacterized protein n=1 Tax=Leadbettera azotonutricia (strain ATCC BAA-888 / DSM 13862 / ZAS-9) TaxID=545695 RepID=F5Y9M0_LEAAZ|nr:hypothetical protein TREAZ_0813 [Leadbettera azotonutricia ZAS-9]
MNTQWICISESFEKMIFIKIVFVAKIMILHSVILKLQFYHLL